MLHFILGRTGSGKTTYIQNKFLELSNQNKNKLMVIVPEQQSFETEKSYLKLLGAKNSSKVMVTSFSRLFDIVLRQSGGLAGEYITDGSRNILMSIAIEQAEEQLDLYKKQAKKQEFTSLMLNTLKEFKSCSISTDTLRKTAVKTKSETLSKKLNEIAIITDIYNSLIEQTYIDPLDNLTVLYKKLQTYSFFKGYTIAIDSFTGFSVQELKIIEQFLVQSENVYIALDGSKAEYANNTRLFQTIKNTKSTLEKMAKDLCVDIEKDVLLEKSYKTQCLDLLHLQENLYRNKYSIYPDNPNNIEIFEAKNIYEECEHIAQTIKNYVTDHNYKYNDFTIIARELSLYRGILDSTLDKYNISYFMDKPRDIESKPLVVFVLSLFEILSNSFNSDYIFRLLKTGLTKLSYEDVSILENYAYIWNISGSKWLTQFTSNPKGFVDKFSETDNALLTKIEGYRKYIIEPLVNFKENIKNASGTEIATEVYKLLEIFNVKTQLKALTERYNKLGLLELSKEQARLWDSIMQILNTMAVTLKDRRISYKRFYDLIKSVIAVTDIGYIPMDLDHVTIGCADRIRPVNQKFVFIAGANDGEFPLTPSTNGIFSNSERKLLVALNLPMHNSLEELASNELLIAYLSASAPSEKLAISYSTTQLTGESKAPSSIISDIEKIFPKINILKSADTPWQNSIWSKRQALEELIKNADINFCSTTDDLKEYFSADNTYGNIYNSISSYEFTNIKKLTSSDYAENLYGKNLNLSASQVEKFYLCQFSYFCRYGLRAKERKKAEIDPSEYGSFIHYILEFVLKTYTVAELNEMDSETQSKILDELIEDYLNNHMGGKEDKTARFLYLFHRVKGTTVSVIKRIIEELTQSKFTPVDFELKINSENGDISPYTVNLLEDNKAVTVSGYIDRVDLMREEDKSYIRIIDYKTGKKKFILSDIKFGLNMQMLIYLAAIYKNGENKYGENIIPSGVLYLHSDVNTIKVNPNENLEDIMEKQQKDYVMSGVILDEEQVISGMEADASGKYIPVVIQNGTAKKGSEFLLDEKQLHAVFKQIDKNLQNMATEIYKGSIAAIPAKGSYDACAYCPYSTACNFTENMQSTIVYGDKKYKETLLNGENGGEANV